ncbi:MAG: hypothetical protein Q9171_006827 [Xanthocarpia ochracea]
MPSSEALTDDYVAQLLAKDAKDRTIKYSSYGLQAILPKRPTTNAPKPNTRFLKNIIKETDSFEASMGRDCEKLTEGLRRMIGGTKMAVPSRDVG